jgi:hypothetical protein
MYFLSQEASAKTKIFFKNILEKKTVSCKRRKIQNSVLLLLRRNADSKVASQQASQ